MCITELYPEKVFHYFKLLSDIPRGSGNEEAAAKFVAETARSLGYSAVIDEANNVFVKADATPGYENHPAIMLQGHLDMVCEANSGTVHDFEKDPIKLILEGDLLHADGTTLGADNGVAVAYMLAILDSDLPHPALECLFTTEEETGLNGMRSFDHTLTGARAMINLDSAGEGEATVSCAGGVRSHILFPVEKEPVKDGLKALRVKVGGLFGGHSGEDINTGRQGALSLMARLLYVVSKACDLHLAEINGGSRDNAIPRECFATILVADAEKALSIIKTEADKIKNELIADDRDFAVSVETTEAKFAISAPRTLSLITLLRNLPHGVHGMSHQVPGLVETSSNLAVIKPTECGWAITVSSRSSVESKLDDMENRVECAVVAAGATVTHDSRYPGWDYLEGSPLQKLYLDTYHDMFGKNGRIIGIHAGLECGLLKGKIPDMDIISIGPNIRDLHSPDEVVSVSSMARTFDLLCEMLKRA